MWTKLATGLYCVAALWLCVFVAYLTFLLLPFGVGPLSSLLAALVAVLLFVWLVRRLLRAPLEHQPIGRRRLILVSILALAALTVDAGWTHYVVPLPPTNQDECSFGGIGPEELRALTRDMAVKLDPDWTAMAKVRGAREEFEKQMEGLIPREAAPERMAAYIHALARSIGAELDRGEILSKAPPGRDYEMGAFYFYSFDLNKTFVSNQPFFRWARLTFHVVQPRASSDQVRLEGAYLLLPNLKGPIQRPPRSRSCPRMPAPPPEASVQYFRAAG